jgi:hypothetical protein
MLSIQTDRRSRYLFCSLFLITLSISLSGCSPERRAMVRLTALNFKSQAYEAIEATKVIYQLTPNARPERQRRNILIRRFLTDQDLDFGEREQIDRVIINTLGQNRTDASSVNAALNDLRQEYIAAAEAFENVERGGLLGLESEAVTRAAKPARQLTVKMFRLAEIIQQNPPSPKSSERILIYKQLSQLRTQYTLAATDEERKRVMENANILLDDLLSINAEEKHLICQTTGKLLLTAQTGSQLSSLLENYKKLGLNEIIAKLTTFLGVASSISGNDLKAINTRVTEVQKQIKDDPVLDKILNELPQSPWNSSTSSFTQLTCP